MLCLEAATNNTLYVVVPGIEGQSLRLQSSPDLLNWSDVSTNTFDASQYVEFFLPINEGAAQFYRTVTP
jgi:hypothetical protein